MYPSEQGICHCATTIACTSDICQNAIDTPLLMSERVLSYEAVRLKMLQQVFALRFRFNIALAIIKKKQQFFMIISKLAKMTYRCQNGSTLTNFSISAPTSLP